MNYRNDIDGLRAVAVVPVVLFHLSENLAPGGFIGVDIFFVISGYLISSIIYREVASGDFSLLKFYERRARRILPAYFAVSLLVFIAVFLLLLPPDFARLSQSLFAANLFSANLFFFWTTDYFGAAASTKPLLHFWSLAVEEQFYIFFPLIILGFRRFRQSSLVWCLVILTIASLIGADYAVRKDQQAAFYLPHLRAWELLIGCLIALPMAKKHLSPRLASLFYTIGCLLIGASVILLRETAPFPGLAALPACCGAALILWAGDEQKPLPSLILSTLPFRFFGKISYSLYLVHWPVIVFAPYMLPKPYGTIDLGFLFGLSVLLAFLSYQFVEQPFRNDRTFWTQKRVLVSSSLSVIAVLCLSLVTILNNGFPKRLPLKAQELLAYSDYERQALYRETICFLTPSQSETEWDEKECGTTSTKPSMLIWGDSYAAHYYSGFLTHFPQHSLGQITGSLCPPILNMEVPRRPHCKKLNDRAINHIKITKPNIVVLSAKWKENDIGVRELNDTIDAIVKAGSQVVLLGVGPRYKTWVPETLARSQIAGQLLLKAIPEDDIRSISAAMKSLFQDDSRLSYVSILDALCKNELCPLITASGIPLHWDKGHLTKEGSDVVIGSIKDQMKPLFAKNSN